MIIPEGWRELDALEQIKVDDLWLEGFNWWEVGDGDVGHLACSMMTTVIRKKVTQ